MCKKTISSLTLIFLLHLTGCASIIDYKASEKMSDKDASVIVEDFSVSQASKKKPNNIEITEKYILWGEDRIYFRTIKNIELLNKFGKYLVQINFYGDAFRNDNWYIVFQTENINDAKLYINAIETLRDTRKKQLPEIDSNLPKN